MTVGMNAVVCVLRYIPRVSASYVLVLHFPLNRTHARLELSVSFVYFLHISSNSLHARIEQTLITSFVENF